MPDPDYTLITLVKLKELMEVTGTSSDTLLNYYRTYVSDIIEQTICDRNFLSRTYTNELYDGSGGKILFLKQAPIVSVSSLIVDDTTVAADEYYVYGSYLHYGAGFPAGQQNIKITYQAGFSSIPSPVEYACFKIIKHMWEHPDALLVKSYELGDYTVKYSDLTQALNSFELRALLTYKRRIFVK